MKRRDSLSLHPAPPSRTDDDEDEQKMTDRMTAMKMAAFIIVGF